MADITKNEHGQLMLLTVFLIVIELVTFVTILNNMIFSSNIPTTGIDKSKEEIRDLRILTQAELVNAAQFANSSVPDPTNSTQVLKYFSEYLKSFNDTITQIYAARGISVEIIFNSLDLNKTMSYINATKYFVEYKNHTFPIGSLIIPMDDNQTTDQRKLMKAYGFVFKIVDNTGPPGTLNGTQIPVYAILQNAVNSSVPNFSSIIRTRNATTLADESYRDYSGGPFIIDHDDLGGGNRDLIMNEAKNKSIKIFELTEPFYYEKAVVMIVPPRVAAYPAGSLGPMADYYTDGDVPYTAVSNADITNGNLTQFDILTIPHQDMSGKPQSVITAIAGWVSNGGVLHIQCLGTDTMDDAVEKWLPSAKPWYGFIGVNGSEACCGSVLDNNLQTYLKFIDSTTPISAPPFNNSYTYNNTINISLPGLADPGAPYSPIAQSSNKSGFLGNSDPSSTGALTFRRNGSQVNPDANILGYAAYANHTPVYLDGDSPVDKIKDLQLIYVSAPYDNGFVSYLAGHSEVVRAGGERLIFENFFAASMRRSSALIFAAKNISVTVKYFDGNVWYSDTFKINP
jgi:stage V sporulation protein SpoVS